MRLQADHACSKATDKQKEQRGCSALLKTPIDIDGHQFFECPRKDFCRNPDLYNKIFYAHRDYREHGILQETGGMMDQAQVLVECFRLLDKVHRDCDKEKEREEKKRAKGLEQRDNLRAGRV